MTSMAEIPKRNPKSMNTLTNRLVGLLAIAFTISSCQAQQDPNNPVLPQNKKAFSDYWYNGEAEIAVYDLKQSRYGELRQGDAVMIYVTENFLLDKQVKDEGEPSENSVTVLKLNAIKDFTTGIYDYNIMRSVFTPIDMRKIPHSLKVSFSSQDWCGQVFSQINIREGKAKIHSFSYFESEGDQELTFDRKYMEDDVWTRIRLNPQALPLGEIEMIPSLEYLRLFHKEIKPYRAKARLDLLIGDDKSGKEHYIYTVEYPELNRKLTLKVESSVPYKLVSWEEDFNTESDDPTTVTSATLRKTMQSPYWQQNDTAADSLRTKLGLDY